MKTASTGVLCLGVLMASAPIASAQFGGSLVQAAQKAKEAKETAPAPDAKAPAVLTNDDLKDVPASSTPSTAATTTQTSATSDETKAVPATDEKPAPIVRDEAWWRTQAGKLHLQFDADQAACVPLRAEVNRLSGISDSLPTRAPAIVAGGIIAAQATASTALATSITVLDQCETTVNVDKATIDALEEDARTHDVPPGWLR